MSVILNGSSQWLSTTPNAPVTGVPFTIAAWGKPANVTADMSIASAEVGTTHFNILQARGTDTGDPAAALTYDGDYQRATTTIGGYCQDQWHHFCGVWAGAANRRAYLNGVNENINTGSQTLSALDRFVVGCYREAGTRLDYWAGRVAHVAIWNVALTKQEVASLAAGTDPRTIKPANLVGYWPLATDGTRLAGSYDLTDNGSPTWDGSDQPTLVQTGYAPQDSFDRDTYSETTLYGAAWKGTTFTADRDLVLTRIGLKLLRVGTPADLVVAVRATSGGLPTGADLASATIAAATLANLTTAAPGQWVYFSLGAPLALTRGTTYGLVVRSPSSDNSNKPVWRLGTPSGYSGGQFVYSADSGSSWSANATYDGTFQLFHRDEDLQDSFVAGDDSDGIQISGNNWRAQTFTPASACLVRTVSCLVRRPAGTQAYVVTCRLFNTSGGVPTTEIDNTTRTWNSLPTTSGWVDFHFDGVSLDAATKYAVVLSTDADGLNSITWRSDGSSPSYSGGAYCYSNNGSGGPWSEYPTNDALFEVWGEAPGGPVYEDMAGTGGGVAGGSGSLHVIRELSGTGGGVAGGNGDLEIIRYIGMAGTGGGAAGGSGHLLSGPLYFLRPVELVTIALGPVIWQMNNSVDIITVNGSPFGPQPGLSHGHLGNGEDPLDLAVPPDHPFVQSYAQSAPGSRATVTIQWLDRENNPGSLRVVYKGMVKSVSFSKDGQEAAIHLESVISTFDRQIPEETFSPQCQNFLYDIHCLVNKEDHKYEGTVSAVVSDTIVVTGLLVAKGAGWALPGYVESEAGNFRQILEQDGDELTLILPFDENVDGQTMLVYAGCDHSHPVCISKFANGNNYRGCPFVPTKNIFTAGLK